MIFAMQQFPGEFTTFDFIPGIPAPFNFFLAILLNQKMLTLMEKIQTAPPLLPMLIEGQPFIEAQDELSVTDFMRKYGMPERINDEVFIAMAKALDFIDPGAKYYNIFIVNTIVRLFSLSLSLFSR
jgi:15-cis-phytoene desaturase